MTIQHTPAPERRRAAHRSAIKGDVPQLTKGLQDHLGQSLLSVMLATQPRQIARWSAGTSSPPAAKEQVLRDIYQVFDLVTEVDTPGVARAWFMGMNPQLDDASPAEAIADGQVRAVMAAARAYVNGG